MKCYHKFESVRTAISLGIGKAKITPPLFKETSVSTKLYSYGSNFK